MPKHKHVLAKIYICRYGYVEKCLDCERVWTTMLDHESKSLVSIPGNFFIDTSRPIVFVVCGNDEQFQEVRKMILDSWEHMRFNDVRRLRDMDMLKGHLSPKVVLWGTWYEDEVIQNSEFIRIMNGWL